MDFLRTSDAKLYESLMATSLPEGRTEAQNEISPFVGDVPPIGGDPENKICQSCLVNYGKN